MSRGIEFCGFPEGRTLAEVESLAGDRYEPAWYTTLNADGSKPAWFLAREDGRLVGFLTIFAPGEGVEVQAFVDPCFRQLGVFRDLWESARRLWGTRLRWFLVCGRSSIEGAAVARHWGHLSFTETTLVLPADRRPSFGGLPEGLELVSVGPEDLAGAIEVHDSANEQTGGYREFAEKVLVDPTRTLVLLKLAGQPVGLVGLHRDGALVELFSLAVHRDYQGLGWGRALVTAALDLGAPGTERFQLEVDSTNGRAESLYRSLGFVELSVTDYYEVRPAV